MAERSDRWVRIAESALDRRDHLAAFCYARKAVAAPDAAPAEQSEAYITLARVSLALAMPEPALAYAVQGHLAACRVRDPAQEGRAARMVAEVIARYPHLDAGDE